MEDTYADTLRELAEMLDEDFQGNLPKVAARLSEVLRELMAQWVDSRKQAVV